MATEKLFTCIPLHRGVQPMDEINPQRSYISVVNNYTFLTNGRTIIVADLRDKFVADFDDEVIDYLEGKYLSKEYWEALHNANLIEVVDDLLQLKSKGKSEFIEYEHPPFYHSDNFLPIDFNSYIVKNDKFAPTANFSVQQSSLDMLAKCSGMNKTDRFIFALDGADRSAKVFINSRDGIFALITTVYEDVEDMFYKAPLQNFMINYRKNEADMKERKLKTLRAMQPETTDEVDEDFEFTME